MIASVRGAIEAVGPDGVVVQVGGVGLFVSCTPTVIAGLRVGQPARLSTSLIVREDALTLYGVADDDERSVFELLQTATGVGPRLAQAVLGVHRPDAVRRAVATDDLAALCLVPSTLVALLGAAAWGLGLSVVFPSAMSAASVWASAPGTNGSS